MTTRFIRQADLVPLEKLQALRITVIGVGAIGRTLTLNLAALGARKLQLFDSDTIELHNVTTQGYSVKEIGQHKVDALAKSILEFDPTIEVTSIKDVFRKHVLVGDVVFCCVDTISARGGIWRSVANRVQFWADGRMQGETLRILAAGGNSSRKHYRTTLFEQSEAHVGRCTSKASLYIASIAAGIMIHQFSRWLRGISVDADLMLNLLASEMTVQPEAS